MRERAASNRSAFQLFFLTSLKTVSKQRGRETVCPEHIEWGKEATQGLSLTQMIPRAREQMAQGSV